MTTSKVSVIVPNYNHAPFLKQRLDSIFNQTFQDFEVIILDDCSTDNSKEIIEQYRSSSKVSHIIYSEKNSGSPFKQWAKGINIAKGKYIWIAESDDWAETTFLENLVPILEENEKIALAFSNSDWFSPSENKFSNIFTKDTLLNGVKFFSNHMITSNSICNASCVLFRKNFAQKISQDYQFYHSIGDWFFWIELCWKGDIFYSAKVLNHFRQHEESTTKKSIRSGIAYEEFIQLFRHMKKKGMIPFSREQRIVVFFTTLPQKIPSAIKCSPEFYNTIRNEWKKEVFSPTLSRFYVDCCYVFWIFKKNVCALFGKDIGTFF